MSKGTTMTNGWRRFALTGSALLLVTGVGACSDPEPETPPLDNSAFDEEAEPYPLPTPEPSIETTDPFAGNLSSAPPAEELPPPAPVAPDEQVMDDASATGMTSRSTRGDTSEDAPAADAAGNQQGE